MPEPTSVTGVTDVTRFPVPAYAHVRARAHVRLMRKTGNIGNIAAAVGLEGV